MRLITQLLYDKTPSFLVILFGISIFFLTHSILQLLIPRPKRFTWDKETSKDLLSKIISYLIRPAALIFQLGPFKTIRKTVETLSRDRIKELLKLAGYPFKLTVEEIQTYSGMSALAVSLIILISTKFDIIYYPHNLIAVLMVYLLPIWVLIIMANIRQNKILADLENFLESLQVYLEGRYTLYEAIRTSTQTTTVLQPYLEACLREWPQGETRALQSLARTIGTPEITLLVARLKQAVDYDAEQLAEYISREANQLDKIKEERGKQFQKTKPLLYMLYIALPGLSAFLIGIWPWTYAIQKSLADL